MNNNLLSKLFVQRPKCLYLTGRRNTPDSSIDKDEGISGDMDELSLSELRLQLELNEQVGLTQFLTFQG